MGSTSVELLKRKPVACQRAAGHQILNPGCNLEDRVELMTKLVGVFVTSLWENHMDPDPPGKLIMPHLAQATAITAANALVAFGNKVISRPNPALQDQMLIILYKQQRAGNEECFSLVVAQLRSGDFPQGKCLNATTAPLVGAMASSWLSSLIK